MEIIYAKDVDTFSIAFLPEKVRRGEGERTRTVELGRGIREWVSRDGEELYAIEVDGHASERAELGSLGIIECEGRSSEEQTQRLFDLPGYHCPE